MPEQFSQYELLAQEVRAKAQELKETHKIQGIAGKSDSGFYFFHEDGRANLCQLTDKGVEIITGISTLVDDKENIALPFFQDWLPFIKEHREIAAIAGMPLGIHFYYSILFDVLTAELREGIAIR